jgi:hypothetical protein
MAARCIEIRYLILLGWILHYATTTLHCVLIYALGLEVASVCYIETLILFEEPAGRVYLLRASMVV